MTGPVRANHAQPNAVELRPADDGTIEIWRGADQIGIIETTPHGIRILLGDADPGGGATLLWGGEPFSMRFDLRGET